MLLILVYKFICGDDNVVNDLVWCFEVVFIILMLFILVGFIYCCLGVFVGIGVGVIYID